MDPLRPEHAHTESETDPVASASAQPPRPASRSVVPYVVLGTGVASLAVSFGAHAPEYFQRYAPLDVAHSTRELHAWLQQHG